MKSNVLIDNVKYILDNYGGYIKNNKQLVLLYWQQIDGVEMDKQSVSTVDYLKKATPESDIINAKTLLKIVKEMEDK